MNAGRRMGLLIIISIMGVLSASPVMAGDLSDLLRAKSPIALSLVSERHRLLDSKRAVCSARLKSHGSPSSCFQVLKLEEQIGLLTRAQADDQRAWLTKACEANAKASSAWDELETWQADALVPESCRRFARERLSDLKYQAESGSPQNLFERRFGVRTLGPDFDLSTER